jgi:hypothetical protein
MTLYYVILQIPRTKYQEPNKLQVPNTKKMFGISVLEFWDLFGICILVLGIFVYTDCNPTVPIYIYIAKYV